MPFALDSNPSQTEISEAINYLLANFGANLAADPSNGQITGPTGIIIAYLYKYIAVKYADSADGSLNFSNSPTNRQYYGLRNSNDTTESTEPADYIWYKATGGFGTTKFLFYSTSGGRQVAFAVATAAPNSSYLQDAGTPIDLDIITTVTGSKAATLVIYKWATSSPAVPSGASVYTWSTGTWSFTPSGWTITSGTSPGSGYNLYTASVILIDAATATTTAFNWSSSSIAVAGSTGQNGNSSHICYAKTIFSSLSPTPTTYTTTGNSSFPPYNTWGGNETWQATAPAIVAGESVYQSDGIYDPVTNITTWNVPYLSNLKVGQLSAISADLGTITAGNIFGTANISISGYAVVSGNYTLYSYSASGHFNGSGSAPNGIVSYAGSGGTGVFAISTSGTGLNASASSGTGANVSSSSGNALIASNVSNSNYSAYVYNALSGGGLQTVSGGTALSVNGNMTINNTNLVNNLNAERWNGTQLVGTVNNGSVGVLPIAYPPVTLTYNQVKYLQINVGGVTGYIPVYI